MNRKVQLAKAVILARKAHRGQLDKTGLPYIEHPMRVMDSVPGIEQKIVAVLHDVVEDTSVTLDDLRRFGFEEELVQAVDSVTRRKGETYREFTLRAKQNRIGRTIKIADIRDNMKRMKGLPESEQVGMTKRYEKALAELEAL